MRAYKERIVSFMGAINPVNRGYFSLIIIMLLFLSISFIPVPLQQHYHVAVKAFLIIAFLVLLVRKRRSIFKLTDWPLWLFLAAIVINVFFAQEKNVAFRTYLDLAMPMFFIYYLVSYGITQKSGFNILAGIISISSILVSAIAIFESLFAFNPIYEYFIENFYYQRYITDFVRPMSTQYNPAVLGSYLLGCLPFNFFLFKKGRSVFRLSGAAGMVLNIVVIILTFSRGVFLGLIVMIVFYLVTLKNYLRMIIFFLVIFMLLFVSIDLPCPLNRFGADRMIKGWDGIFSSYRFNRCIMTKDMIKDFPLTGIGFQHFRTRFYEYYPEKYNISYEFMIADNMYFTILAETGIIGFFAFLILLFSLFRKGWAQLKLLKKHSQERLQLLIILCAFIGLAVNMGAYELFYWPNQYMFFCIIIGLLESFYRRMNEH